MKSEGLKSLLIIIAIIVIISIGLGIILRMLPLLILIGVIYYFYRNSIKQKEVKWYEGSTSDSYYEKVKNKDVIDVEVKVKENKYD